MLPYYILFFSQFLISQLNSIFIFKKFQLQAGTSLIVNGLYLFINGIVSALVAAIMILVTGGKLEITPYSVVMAVIVVTTSAISTVACLKSYERGQIASVNILTTIGGIIISCIWGVLVWNETITTPGFIAIIIMIAASVLMVYDNNLKIDKKLLWLYLVTVVFTVAVTLLCKQHQMETRFETVDSLSFSVWIGVVRTVMLLPFLPVILQKIKVDNISWKVSGICVGSSAVTGVALVMQLFYAAVLPVSVTSPLSTGLGIILSALLPWLFFREKINRKQFYSVVLSLIGSLLYVLT